MLQTRVSAENYRGKFSLENTLAVPALRRARIAARLVNLWPNDRLDELMPWAWATARQKLRRAA
jgi:hypothetical protein